MPSFRGKKTSEKHVGEIRKSKMVTNAGIGALVDFPNFSGIMAGQNLWDTHFDESMKIHERNLEKFLDKEFFVQVSSNTELNSSRRKYRIPIVRFPEYYYCPQCGELDYARRLARNWNTNKENVEVLKCSKCNHDLLPSRFIVACENGHIDEFPYAWWAHKNKGMCDNPRLILKSRASSGSLESLVVSCDTCGASNSMADALNVEAFSVIKCHGRSPWLGKGSGCVCDKKIRPLLRGASNVYFSDTKSALTIPPWSTDVQNYINLNIQSYKTLYEVGKSTNMLEKLIENEFEKHHLAQRFRCTLKEFMNQIELRFDSDSEKKDLKEFDFITDEYFALSGSDKNDLLFKTEEAEIDNELLPYIEQIKLVKRLREVQVLDGFHRISLSGDLAPISTKRETWLPAVEMLGEGVFLRFPEKCLRQWANKNQLAYEAMGVRYKDTNLEQRYGAFSPIYVLLHSISHMLIKEFSFKCGYDMSSLKEKIYFSDDDQNFMAGILVYTATTSSDGSLGGLVRLGYCKSFRDILLSALDKSIFCSNDPICIESTNQGYKALNYAACHSCMLLPEVSCCNNNICLDRGAIVGSLANNIEGYFSDLITGGSGEQVVECKRKHSIPQYAKSEMPIEQKLSAKDTLSNDDEADKRPPKKKRGFTI